MIPLVKVYSMVAVQTSSVLLGTDSGHILVYDGYSRKKSHQFSPLHDPVLSLQFFKYVANLRCSIPLANFCLTDVRLWDPIHCMLDWPTVSWPSMMTISFL